MFVKAAARYFVSLVLAGCVCASAVAQENDLVDGGADPERLAADIQSGRILVGIACALCHGIDGSGGRGPDLVGGMLRHGSTDEAIFRNIQNGIRGTAMGAFRWADAEVWQVVRYIQSRRQGVAAVELRGDADRGRELFAKNHCATCHWTGSRGGRLGPDLARSRSSLAHTRAAILEPSADVDAKYEPVILVLRDGRVASGLRLNENTYHIQLIDTQERLHTIPITEVEVLHRPRTSTMPSYHGFLSDADLDDLVKYLFFLRESS